MGNLDILFIGGTGTLSAACSQLAVARGMNLWLLNRGTRNDRAPARANLLNGDINKLDESMASFLRSRTWDVVVDWVVFTPQQASRDVELFRDRTESYFFIGTTAVYCGTRRGHRIVESDPVGNEAWSYASDKLACEQVFSSAYEEQGFPVTTIRPGHTYADFTLPTNIAGLGFGIIDRLLEQKPLILHDDGESVWTLTHNTDFAVGLLGLFGNRNSCGQTYHVTASEATTWREILKYYGEALEVEPVFTEIPSSWIATVNPELGVTLIGDRAKHRAFDNSKIQSAVPEFEPSIGYREGIMRSIDWHKNNAQAIRYNPDVSDEITRIIDLYNQRRAN